MNTQLQKLFEKARLSDKDKYEINQIFWLLPLDKQQNILDNFDALVFRLEQMYKEIELERRILIWDIFTDVKNLYNKYS
jgi:hypothetical protein